MAANHASSDDESGWSEFSYFNSDNKVKMYNKINVEHYVGTLLILRGRPLKTVQLQ